MSGVVFERGFKTWCESFSVQSRRDLGLLAHSPLNARDFAKHLGVRVWTPKDFPALSKAASEILLRNDGKTPSSWSAVTVVVGERAAVILNSSHSAGRQSNDLMHELAHRIRGHRAHGVDFSRDGVMLLHQYDKVFEDEADWLAGCLLLPREALLRIKRSRASIDDAAEEYGVSGKLLSYRLAISGVNRQLE